MSKKEYKWVFARQAIANFGKCFLGFVLWQVLLTPFEFQGFESLEIQALCETKA